MGAVNKLGLIINRLKTVLLFSKENYIIMRYDDMSGDIYFTFMEGDVNLSKFSNRVRRSVTFHMT